MPIEVKKDSHRDLWTAMHDQLIARYTTDPETHGFGIYVVLWFGCNSKPPTRHPSGARPENPDEMRRLLEECLTPAEARKIAAVVIEVSGPIKDAGW